MPTVDASKNILSAGASYAADDWASAGAEASLDFQAQAQLRRGIDLGIGAEAGVRLEGGLQKFLSADVQGQASAAARVRAQVEVPLDLFDEAGLAVRLQAVAEAAAGVNLAVGLKVGDFLALAQDDPRLRGVPLELLKVFLTELDIQGGVMAKAAASAMAYANLALTGRLIKSGAELPGFTVAAEAGVGLKAGAGFKVFARFKVADPRRLMRRSIDIAVDGSIDAALPLLPDREGRRLMDTLRTPAKIALRTAFEVGMALAENQGAYRAGDGGKIALRCVQVALEEAQRFILERTVDYASRNLNAALRELGFNNARWQASLGARRGLADRLRALPEEPFEATQANLDYWNAVLDEASAVAMALSASGDLPPEVRTPLALVWSATQLLFISVERISVATARASMIGMSPSQTTAAYSGPLDAPPQAIRAHINAALGHASGASIGQADVVHYLVETLHDSALLQAPEIGDVLTLVLGPNAGAGADALDALFTNLGAFVPGADGRVSAQATLTALRDALVAYVDERVRGELQPALSAVANGAEEVQTYLDEVVISTLRTVTGPVFDTVIAWGSGDQDTQRALRELCSSLVFRLLGRSLVVCGDVLTVKAQETIQGELRQLAAHVNDAGGAAPVLAALTHLDRAFIAEVLEETLLVCADTFEPMSADRRAQVRGLLYQILDTAPAPDNANAVAELRNAALIPNAEAAFELARLLGEEIAGNVVRFVQALLIRVGLLILEELQEAIRAIQRAVEEWIEDLQALAQALALRLVALVAEIDRLGRAFEAAGDVLLGQASALLGVVSAHTSSRAKLRDALATYAADKAVSALRAHAVYAGLPREARQWARDHVRDLVRGMLDNALLDPVLDAISRLTSETADFLDDVRAIEPGDNIPAAVADLFLDRFEDALRDVFGHSNPRLSIDFTVPLINVGVSFGVSLPLGPLISAIRSAVRGLDQFNDSLGEFSASLADLIVKENALRAAEDEHAALAAHRDRTDRHLVEARAPTPALTIVSPQPGAAYEGAVTVTLRVEGVSPAWLGLGDGEQQRIFAWVNQQEMSASELTVTRLASPPQSDGDADVRSIDGIHGVRPVQHPLVSQRALVRDHASGTRSAKLARLQGADRRHIMQAGLSGRAGLIERVHGKPATGPALADRLNDYRPGRTLIPVRGSVDFAAPAARGGLLITAQVPATLLHEGINTLVCALVPGPADRRIEQVVSFLVSAPLAPVKGRGDLLPMPGRLAWDKTALADGLKKDLTARFGADRVTTGKAEPPPLQRTARQLWHPPKAERTATVARTTAKLKTTLPAGKAHVAAIQAALKSGGFRPVVVQPAVRPKAPAAVRSRKVKP